jgi:cyanophycin synthetase
MTGASTGGDPSPRRWSRTNQLIIAAAARLGVTAEPLSATETDFFLRLRRGGRAVIVSKTRSPFLTQVAQTLSNNKRVSRELLGADGLPVPPDRLVDDQRGADEVDAAGFLAAHGALTVKPNWGNRASGLTARVEERATLIRAIERAQAADRDEEALLEPYLPGVNLRVAVIGGRVEAIAEIQRPVLRGDGERSATAAVAELNRDPRRTGWRRPRLVGLDRVALRGEVAEHLAIHGLDVDAPLPEGFTLEIVGEEVEIIDRTEAVDPGWGVVATRACALLGVDVGGVDLRGPLECFLRPPPQPGPEAWREGALLEVNVLPALHLHALPTVGSARPVFEAFVAYCLSLPGAPPPRATVEAAAARLPLG